VPSIVKFPGIVVFESCAEDETNPAGLLII
jgi:hypothetical protein